MDDRFSRQLKKGMLEMLVLELICQNPTYGYELILQLKARSEGLFALKEGTLYPILYRLEDEGMIRSGWTQSEGREKPKKVYSATEAGREENARQWEIWGQFVKTTEQFKGGTTDER